MKKTEKLFKALSDKNRIRIIAALRAHEEMCACQIVELLQVTGATVSRHLSVLVSVGLLENRKEGRWVFYHLDHLEKNHQILMDWLETQLSQSATIMRDKMSLKNIMTSDREEICRKQRDELCCPPKTTD